MTRLLAIVLALGLATTQGFASVRVFDNTDKNLGVQNDIKCGDNISCAVTSGKAVISLDTTLSGVFQTQTASTTTDLTSAACGTTIVSNSADVVDLPEASTVLGCRITFVCGTADDFDVNPADASDTIGRVVSVTGSNTTTVLSPSAGDAIRCTDIGSSIMLEAVAADLWVSVGASNGTWTDVN